MQGSKRHATFVFGVVVCATACGGRARVEPHAPSTVPGRALASDTAPSLRRDRDERLEGYVVTAVGTRLRLEPRHDAPWVVTARTDDLDRLRKLRLGHDVYRFVADHGALLEIESTGEPISQVDGQHCETGPRELSSLSVRFFVERRDLLPVVNRPLAISHADGTALRLLEGVALLPHSTSAHHVVLEAANIVFTFRPETLAGHVGLSYRPGPRLETGKTTEELDPDAFDRREALLGGKALAARYPRMMQRVYARRAAGARDLVVLHDRCAEVTVSVPRERVTTEDHRPMLTLSMSESFKGPRVRKDAKLYDRSGRRIGLATNETGFDAEVASVGEHRCFTRTLPGAAKQPNVPPPRTEEILTLCAHPRDILESEDRQL